jgi:uncharacterized delta-60 repeat protein
LIGDIAVDMFDRIVMTGGSYNPYPNNYFGNEYCYYNIFLYRYLPSGAPDPSFGENGSVELEYTGTGRGNALLHYEDGRILLAGAAGLPDSYPSYFFLARLMPDGTLDSTFADNGRFRKALLNYGLFSGGNVEPFGLLRMRERIIVGVLNEITGDDPGFGAVCLKEDGKIDSTFGKAGRFNPFPDIGMQSFINQINTTADNNFFLYGYTRLLQPNNMAIVKVQWDFTSGTEEQALLQKVNIYPNPVREGFFNIHLGNHGLEEGLSLIIRDVNGKCFYEQDHINDLAVIRIHDFPNGLYLVELAGQRSHYIGKIVVQNQ